MVVSGQGPAGPSWHIEKAAFHVAVRWPMASGAVMADVTVAVLFPMLTST